MHKSLLVLIFTLIYTLGIKASANSLPVFIYTYEVSDYKASSQNWDLTVSSKGILYAACNSGLLTFDGNNWITYELPDRSILYNVLIENDTLYTRGETTLGYWLPDSLGALQFNSLMTLPNHLKFKEKNALPPYTLPDYIVKDKVTAFAEKGDLHIVGTFNGVYILNAKGEVLRHLTIASGLHDNMVHAVYIESSERIWLAFDSGLARIMLNPSIYQIAKRSNVGKLEEAAYEDQVIYIKTNRGYFKCIIGEDYPQQISEEEGLRHIQTRSTKTEYKVSSFFRRTETLADFTSAENVYPISEQECWLSKGSELGLFTLQDGVGFFKYRLNLNSYQMDLVCKGRRMVPLNDSLSLASAMQGVLLINTNKLSPPNNFKGLPAHLVSVKYQDNKGVHALPIHQETIKLPYNFQEFTVLTGSSVFDMDVPISYKIEGVTSEWSQWQTDGKISFLQLPQGSYQLKIRKYTSYGEFPELILKIRVMPPWYKTYWAYLFYILLFSLIGYLIATWYRKNLQAKEQSRLLREKAAEEHKIQQLRNEMLESELQNKKHELVVQTSALVRRNAAMDTLLEELERQKESLGDRYPAKYYQQMRSLLEHTLSDQDDWSTFETYFNSAHQNFIQRLKQDYPDITPGDVRLCCFLRMNLSTKEIASLLHISVRAIEIRRYRLRKRMDLDNETNLSDFLINF